MARLEIKTYPDKILTQKAKPVKSVGSIERQIVSDMIETMRSSEGVGLAAPQVGINRRVIVIEDTENKREPTVFINPRILKRKGRSIFCEGCLSVPGVTSDVARPESITLEAADLNGNIVRMDAGGLFARIIQHEIDHLDGILFIDRIGFLERKKILKQVSQKICMEL